MRAPNNAAGTTRNAFPGRQMMNVYPPNDQIHVVLLITSVVRISEDASQGHQQQRARQKLGKQVDVHEFGVARLRRHDKQICIYFLRCVRYRDRSRLADCVELVHVLPAAFLKIEQERVVSRLRASRRLSVRLSFGSSTTSPASLPWLRQRPAAWRRPATSSASNSRANTLPSKRPSCLR